MLLQHYHTSTALSKKLDASFRYLQLQLGTPQNPLTLPFEKWGYLTPLSWVKMLWHSLDKFNIQLQMKYPTIPFPRERDQVIMEIVLERTSSTAEIQSLNRCRGMLQCIFLSDMVTADGRYLESFVFDPGPVKRRSNYRFPRECPSQKDWETWFNFWHNYVLTGDKLKIPLGGWINPTHRKWLWYLSSTDDLHRIEDDFVYHYLPTQATRRTRSALEYNLTWKEKLRGDQKMGRPVSVRGLNDKSVSIMNTGPLFSRGPHQPSDFWEFLRSWGGEWMWDGIEDSQGKKLDLSWLIEGMRTNLLLWVTDGSYDRKRAPVISGVGWIVFCKTTGKRLVGSFWEKSPSASSYKAKLLGLCALHLFAWALSEFYKVSGWKATLGWTIYAHLY